MRPKPRSGPSSLGPRPTYSPRRTLAGTLLLVAAFVGVLLAVSYPVTAVLVGLVAVAGWRTARSGRERLRRRRETGRSREVCLPAADVCIEA